MSFRLHPQRADLQRGYDIWPAFPAFATFLTFLWGRRDGNPDSCVKDRRGITFEGPATDTAPFRPWTAVIRLLLPTGRARSLKIADLCLGRSVPVAALIRRIGKIC